DGMIAGTRRDFLRLAGGAAGASIVSLSTLSTSATRAAALACHPAQAAVHVDVSLPEPILDNSQPQRAIQALAPGYHGGRTVGLYASEVAANTQTQFRSIGLRRDAPACLFITDVKVGITMPKRRIYVSSELWPGTCQHTAVLDHERKHQATDDLALRKHAPRIQGAIENTVANLDPLQASADEHEAAQARLTRLVQSAFDRAWTAFLAERSELQRQVDAGLEYARVTASCSDWSQIQQ
ncbi:MAG: hypothetical protein ACREFI_17845, partial [Stellaceae bacterium]